MALLKTRHPTQMHSLIQLVGDFFKFKSISFNFIPFMFWKKIDEQKIAAFFRKNSTLVNIKNEDGDYPIHSAAKQGIAIGLQTDS